MMADRRGVVSSVILGPDQRSRITVATRNVLFAVYAPSGVGSQAVRQHLERIRGNVGLITPAALLDALEVAGAGC